MVSESYELLQPFRLYESPKQPATSEMPDFRTPKWQYQIGIRSIRVKGTQFQTNIAAQKHMLDSMFPGMQYPSETLETERPPLNAFPRFSLKNQWKKCNLCLML